MLSAYLMKNNKGMNNSRRIERHRQTWKALFSEKGLWTKMAENIVDQADDCPKYMYYLF